MCLMWSWYLANDFQFYIVAIVLLILSTRWGGFICHEHQINEIFADISSCRFCRRFSCWLCRGLSRFLSRCNSSIRTKSPIRLSHLTFSTINLINDSVHTRLVSWIAIKISCFNYETLDRNDYRLHSPSRERAAEGPPQLLCELLLLGAHVVQPFNHNFRHYRWKAERSLDFAVRFLRSHRYVGRSNLSLESDAVFNCLSFTVDKFLTLQNKTSLPVR